MTEIANFEPDTGGSLATITGGHLPAFIEWTKTVALSNLVPEALRGKPADVLICVFHGLDLGLKPTQAFNFIDVIKGKPAVNAKGMRALLARAGHDFEIVQCDLNGAVVRGRRRGTDKWHEAKFMEENRRLAKLSGANWDAYREDMYLARATTRLCNRHFPDVIGGLDSTEDLMDRHETPQRSLADVAAARETTPEPEVVDAELVDEANRAAVADMEAGYARKPAQLFADDADLPEPNPEWAAS